MSFDAPSRSASSSSFSGTSKKRPRSNSSTTTSNPRNPRRRAPFTDFGTYMTAKNQKLRDQFEADASTSSLIGGDREGIFHGVSIFVDGFTVPSSQELKGFMLKHGGRFENYFSRHRVTHIICSHLPDSKLKNFRAFSRGLPVVKPSWVLDSVSANKLLNYAPYQVIEFGNESGKQKKLSAFFTPKSISTSADAEAPMFSDAERDAQGSMSTGEDSKNIGEGSASLGNEEVPGGISGEPHFADLEDEHSVAEAFDSSPHKTDAVGSSRGTERSSNTKYSGGLNLGHSTLSDPNFVENYFKNSRLHFIGTWRNRYQKRFSNIHAGVVSNNTQVNSLAVAKEGAIIHIDMDCFFVSVVIRNFPELLNKPVAVCHSDNPKGTAEISSANYPARDYGVKAGMFVRDAKARCPHLVIVPYDFEAYEEVADQFYIILHKHCNKVQAVSCDEAFLDVTESANNGPEQVALMIRKEITESTRCTASAGIAGNLLLARLATKSAKPNGQCFIPSDKVDNYICDLPIEALPGIGHAIGEKLKSRQIETCGHLRLIAKESLHKDFGTKIGDMLWNYCRGIDTRTVEFIQKIKSVGAEVNWGVRFNDTSDCHSFLMKLCKEVSLRLQGCGVQGRTITMKVKKRKKGASEPIKFMGCGDCESMSRSTTLSVATDNLVVLQRMAKQIFDSLHIDVKEVRGVGLQISKLENAGIAKQGHAEKAIKLWLATSEKSKEQYNSVNPVKQRHNEGVRLANRKPLPNSVGHLDSSDPSGSYGSRDSILPPLSDLDVEVIKNLPPEIFSEVNVMYNGKLCDFMEEFEGKKGRKNATLSTTLVAEASKAVSSSIWERFGSDTDIHVPDEQIDSVELQAYQKNKGKQPMYPAVSICNTTKELNKEGLTPTRENMSNEKLPHELTSLGDVEVVSGKPYQIQLASTSCSRSNDLADRTDLMPCSLSQVDASILEQLPEDVKSDIFELLPAHRSVTCCGNDPSVSAGKLSHAIETQNSENFKINLWLGNPPKWVEKFKVSSCVVLNIIAELHAKSGTTGLLSSILQPLLSFLPSDISIERLDEALSSLCELLTQYIYLRIDTDIEELYICFRLLKRFASTSKFLLQVYNIVLPTLQASVSENYGGELQLSVMEDSVPEKVPLSW